MRKRKKKDIFEKVPQLVELDDVETFLNQKGTMMVIKGRIVFVEDDDETE